MHLVGSVLPVVQRRFRARHAAASRLLPGAVRLLAAVLLLLVPAMPGTPAGPAYAVPDDEDSADAPEAATLRLGWPALGLPNNVELGPYFMGPFNPDTYAVPVPAGMTAVRLQGVINHETAITPGYLEISDGAAHVLATVDLPPASSASAAIPFDVDIAAAGVQASSITLSFAVRPTQPIDRICGPLELINLNDLATVYRGVEPAVTTIASFFPTVLNQVTVYAPVGADTAEQQSVLALVSTLARLYRLQSTVVTVVNHPRRAAPPPAGQLKRAIVVETGDAGINVENPGRPEVYLRISGHGDELTRQVALLIDQLQSMAQTPTVRVDDANAVTPQSAGPLTFGDLKMKGKADVLRINRMSVAASRSALGPGRVDTVQVHLLADYTPVLEGDRATVVIRSQGFVLYRSLLDDTGRLDATFTLDRRVFGQWLTLDFVLTYTPNQLCSPMVAPLTFQLDPQSTLTVHHGGPPLGGFDAFPSEFSPGFQVALDGSSPNQLGHAAAIVAAVARQTDVQLTPRVVDLEAAAESNSGALIVAESQAIRQTSLTPPVGGDNSLVDFRLPDQLRADLQGGLASIQAFADRPHNRSVILVTTTGAWTLADPLFTYLDQLNGGWPQLFGDVLAAGAAGTPTNVEILVNANAADRTGAAAAGKPAGSSVLPSNPWVVGGIGVAVTAMIAGVARALWTRRRAPRSDTPDDEPAIPPHHRA